MRREAARLLEVLDGFGGRRVAVLGDLVVDEFVYGEISRVSREAPVLILDHDRTEIVPGGGGNAVANLAALGARPLPVGVVGRDPSGAALLDWMRGHRIPVTGIARSGDHATPTKSRVLAGGVHTRRQQVVRVDRGAGKGSHPPPLRADLRKRLQRALERAEGLLIADYGHGAADPEIASPAAAKAAEAGLPVTVDSRARVTGFRNLTACTPNQEEAEVALGLPPLRTEDAVADAGRRLLRRTGHEAVLVTRGAQGMSLFRKRRKPLDIPAFGSDEVADVTGAGDTVIATFTLALIAGADLVEAARLANYAAGLVVMKAGTATVTPAELRQAILEDLT